MAKKTLNNVGIEARKNFKGRIYTDNDNDSYSAEHDRARTHDDDLHPHGKGTPDKPYLYTKDGGGSYDKVGRQGAGEGRAALRLNEFSPNNSYEENHPQIDEDLKGQFYVRNNFLS